MVRGVLQRSGINYVEVPNEAAFYGPKIDVQVWSAIGREFTIATNQVDFAVPKRFGLVYKTRENTEATPLCIHRAPLGTHERFIGFLIEHYAGNFPLWLAPEQVRVLPIGDEPPLLDYAQEIVNELRAHEVRCESDFSSNKINGKIQHAEQEKVHTMLVIGRRDLEAGAVSVRVHGKGNLGAKPRAVFFWGQFKKKKKKKKNCSTGYELSRARQVAGVQKCKAHQNPKVWVNTFRLSRILPACLASREAHWCFGIGRTARGGGHGLSPCCRKGSGNQLLPIFLSQGLQPNVGFEFYPFEYHDHRVVLFEINPAFGRR